MIDSTSIPFDAFARVVGPANRRAVSFASAVVCCLIWLSSASVQAQDITLSDLSDDEYKALEWANEKSVTATIAFLASDELEGRGTPSRGFTIASAYVAARFRGAGLEGLGPDGSFHLESMIDTTLTPDNASFMIEGGDAVAFRQLIGGNEDVGYDGPIPIVTSLDDLADVDGTPVALRWNPPSDSADRSRQIRALTSQAAGQDASCLILAVDTDDVVWKWATSLQTNPSMGRARQRFALPVLLVETAEWDADATCRLGLPANRKVQSMVRNTCGILRGSDETLADEVIVFSAHLDHLGRNDGNADPIYNGADDDATGVTAVLTLADIFAALPERPKRSVMFLTFWGEESGMLGSRKFVRTSPWPLDKIVANVNIEMIGRPEEGASNKTWMTGWTESNLGSLVAQGSRRVGVETFEHKSFSSRLYRASDNISFVEQGVVAHSFSAGSLHGDYHQPTDDWERLDRTHMTQIIRGLFAGSLPIAQGTLTPKKR